MVGCIGFFFKGDEGTLVVASCALSLPAVARARRRNLPNTPACGVVGVGAANTLGATRKHGAAVYSLWLWLYA